MKKIWSKFLAWIRNYAGATFSTTRSQVRGAVQDARRDLPPATRRELIRRSRAFERDNALVNRLADLFEEFTVGPTGLQLISASADEAWKARATASFETWSQEPDLISSHDLATLEKVCARTWFIDGEIFIVKTRTDDPRRNRARVQLLESHRIETPTAMRTEEGKSVTDGVAISPVGRPIGYYVRDGDGAEASYRRIDAANVIHIFRPGRTGQYRGLPFLSPVLNDLTDLDDLQNLEMQCAKEAARIANVIKNKAGELNPAMLRRARMSTGTIDSLGNASTTNTIDHYKEVLGANTIAIGNNEEIQQFRSDRPSVASQDYWDFLMTKICAGSGISKLLALPSSKQGTVVRLESELANCFFRAHSAILATAFVQVWQYAIGNDFTLGSLPSDWRKVTARPPRSPNIDVGRNSSAMLAELKAGATNYELIYAPLGLDPFVELRKGAVFAKYIRDLATEFDLPPGAIAGHLSGEKEMTTAV